MENMVDGEGMVKHRLCAIVMIAWFSLISGTAAAQETPPAPACPSCTVIFRSDSPNNLIRGNTTRWLPDSHSLVFDHQHSDCTCDYLHEFSVVTNRLQEIFQSPFTVRLTSDERRSFASAGDLVFVSPDGQFI